MSFPELHDELRSVARDLLARGADWSSMVGAGWVGLEVPESLDGSGATFAETAVVLEELGRAAASTSLFGTAVLGVPALGDHDLLRSVADGEVKLAVAFGDFALTGGAVSGRATFVADAAEADRLLLVVDDAVVLVEPGALVVTPEPVLDATRRFATVVADGVPGEVRHLDVAALRDRAALAVACDSLGVGHAMLDATVAYAKVRTQFGQPIGSFQAVKHQCADMLVQLTVGRELLAAAVESLDPLDVARAKAFLGQAGVDVAGTAMQLHGGIGYTWESDVHVFLKRAILNRVWFGSPAEHRRRLAAAIVTGGEPSTKGER